MNLITQTTLDRWRNTRTKISPSGWEYRNAICCHHRGHNQDKKGRGGIKLDGENISYHCFNCNFKTSYSVGKPLYPKFIKLLEWLGIDSKTIFQLKLESLRIAEPENIIAPIIKRELKSVDLPESVILCDNQDKYPKHVDFLKKRGFIPEDFPFLISDSVVYRNRVIIPFIMQDTIIGYSARSIVDNESIRYIMKMTVPFVFGLDFVKPQYEWVILTEGLFDALSVKGLAVMHNEINEDQINLVNDLQKRIIVVPHLDKAGLVDSNNSLINVALDNNWEVSYPEWNCKDINEAYVKYGSLFVIKHILDMSTNNYTTIKLKQKMFNNELKGRDE
jgi:hypothetical protein